MQIEVLKNEKDFCEFVIKGERHTFPNLLRSKLLKDPAVTFVAYNLEHPQDADSKFVVRTKGKAPKKVLSDACATIEAELEDFNKSVKKALK